MTSELKLLYFSRYHRGILSFVSACHQMKDCNQAQGPGWLNRKY